MEDMIKLSFVVPVYNVEHYLRKCVDSLLAQNYEDYEIILVDDGSMDHSGAICDDYSAMYENIRVIHQPNSGVGAARNTGIKTARGKYICFVDSDDYWEPNVLGELMVQIERDKLDVLRFKYQNVNECYEVFNPNKSAPYRHDDYSEVVTDGITFLNTRFSTACYPVMFILKRELLEDCLFVSDIYFEDTDWTPRMLAKAQRIASTDTIVYNYLVRQGSITNAIERTKQRKVLEDKIRIIGELQDQANQLRAIGRDNNWYGEMIANTVISIIGMCSSDFYKERGIYINKIYQLGVFPISPRSFKARLINISPRIMVEILHFRNIRKCKNQLIQDKWLR